MRRISDFIENIKDDYFIVRSGNIYRLKYDVEKYIKAIDLRRRGLTYKQISNKLGISQTTLFRRVNNYPEHPYKMLTPTYGSEGYRKIGLYNKEGDQIYFRVARLMGYCYLGLQKNSDLVVNHKNGVKDDDRIENLEVVTISENMKHAIKELGYNPLDNLGEYAIGRKV